METAPDAVSGLARARYGSRFPEGVPNFEPRGVPINDHAPTLRAAPVAVRLPNSRNAWLADGDFARKMACSGPPLRDLLSERSLRQGHGQA